jgi:hypothetical protein
LAHFSLCLVDTNQQYGDAARPPEIHCRVSLQRGVNFLAADSGDTRREILRYAQNDIVRKLMCDKTIKSFATDGLAQEKPLNANRESPHSSLMSQARAREETPSLCYNAGVDISKCFDSGNLHLWRDGQGLVEHRQDACATGVLSQNLR